MSPSKFLKFIPDAEAARGRSKDANTQVGCVVVDWDYNIRASGYNGPPRGVKDLPERLSRPEKYKGWMAHAEENTVSQAARMGVSLHGCTIILTSLYPCSTCARLIIQSGIKQVIAPKVEMDERWSAEWAVSRQMFLEAGVEVYVYDPVKKDSLETFA